MLYMSEELATHFLAMPFWNPFWKSAPRISWTVGNTHVQPVSEISLQ